ncbi:hypothetical protein [Acinetobacter baumannii]|uniref:hypothetical protein n=1 Tax=Acinetobacter baumannii TaxID=470 RepID=UPI0012EE8049|nr:hypothetical protein [Acinetobacter baumannii]MVM68154.1 hypothetical protein [Acinetobacter baumannii]
MTDLNKEREAFEEALGKHNIHNVHLCTVYDFKRNEYFPSDVCDPSEDRIVDSINLSWKMWLEKAKAQAVPDTHIVVPKEPTKEMLKAGIHSYLHQDSIKEKDGSSSVSFKHIYQAMLEASESGAEG